MSSLNPPRLVRAESEVLSRTTVIRMVKKYGLPMLITADEELKAYLDTILKQVHGTSTALGVLVQVPRHITLDRHRFV